MLYGIIVVDTEVSPVEMIAPLPPNYYDNVRSFFMREIWKDIDGYNGLYQVSNYGRVKRLKRVVYNKLGHRQVLNEKLLKPYESTKYLQVMLVIDGNKKNERVHRLVAKAFIDNPLGKDVINHIDFNTYNNRSDNLEWVTTKENVQHSAGAGRLGRKKITTNYTDKHFVHYFLLTGKNHLDFCPLIEAHARKVIGITKKNLDESLKCLEKDGLIVSVDKSVYGTIGYYVRTNTSVPFATDEDYYDYYDSDEQEYIVPLSEYKEG